GNGREPDPRPRVCCRRLYSRSHECRGDQLRPVADAVWWGCARDWAQFGFWRKGRHDHRGDAPRFLVSERGGTMEATPDKRLFASESAAVPEHGRDRQAQIRRELEPGASRNGHGRAKTG